MGNSVNHLTCYVKHILGDISRYEKGYIFIGFNLNHIYRPSGSSRRIGGSDRGEGAPPEGEGPGAAAEGEGAGQGQEPLRRRQGQEDRGLLRQKASNIR